MTIETRYRMQSLRTGWGVEAPCTREGSEALKRLRKEMKDKFKWCRVYVVRQPMAETIPVLEPFQLTHHRFC